MTSNTLYVSQIDTFPHEIPFQITRLSKKMVFFGEDLLK